MFKRSFRSHDRVDKSARLAKKSNNANNNNTVRDPQKLSKLQRSLEETLPVKRTLNSPIVTLTVGREGRLFAAHEEVLCQSPFFEQACRDQYLEAQSKRIALPDQEPEVFSAVLEYLYKGDYYPRLLHNKHRNSWELEDAVRSTPDPSSDKPSHHPHHPNNTPTTNPNTNNNTGGRGSVEATMYVSGEGQYLLRDTVVYCAADKFGLEELKRLALRKQGLQSGIDVATILRSAQYAYDHTPDTDSRLRAHYLALIIRCRKTFKRSGTMQAEMERGGSKLFFDLFVAMCNHLDDVVELSNARTPKTI
ncbi:hypothetical protein MGN70_014655 [Eutypa lata]|uniref:Putative btb poz domain containing protein n=1 Tax=Eutypa lata (strain UCR-EL1) TaxID=1287681 RepID=M7SLN8_EUTLA|nr:putative btb poz domain containing protein [Eutypa lata UCREL1]KAI1244778.1 hypothetical protein MGN70_014655 [Eutypa lata]